MRRGRVFVPRVCLCAARRKSGGGNQREEVQAYNFCAGICQNHWVAPIEYTGTTDSKFFEWWFEHCLLKAAKPGSVIVLDNATFHRKSKLPALAQLNNCTVLFLPAYSPDLNPIEKKWAWLKKRLRKILPDFDSFELAVQNCF